MTTVHIIHLKYVDSHLGLGCASCRVCERVTNMTRKALLLISLEKWRFFFYILDSAEFKGDSCYSAFANTMLS